ncbi:unnamed protein product, partial [Phaeothamnion confervicola]
MENSLPGRRTLLAVGISPESFATEIAQLFPFREASGTNQVASLVWMNTNDPPPPLPYGWTWDEVLSARAEDIFSLPQTQAWGQVLAVIGAGATVDATGFAYVPWKSAAGSGAAPYPFDGEQL